MSFVFRLVNLFHTSRHYIHKGYKKIIHVRLAFKKTSPQQPHNKFLWFQYKDIFERTKAKRRELKRYTTEDLLRPFYYIASVVYEIL